MACAPYAEQAPERDEAPASDGTADTRGSEGSGSESSGPAPGDTADVSCADVGDALDPDREILFRFVNASDHDVWLEALSCRSTFDVENATGTSLASSMAGACPLCVDLLEGACEAWCEDHCDGYLVRVEPGAVHEEAWSGTLRDTVTVACGGCEGACDMRVPAPPGDHLARVTLHETCDAIDDACTCEATAGGSCEVWGATTSSPPMQIEAAFSLPETTTVELSFP
jgi:hypothetical protein